MENTLTDDQFEKLGEKIVKQLYGGDVRQGIRRYR